MWQKSLAWAQSNNRHRKHPIHGEDQIQIVLSETFEVKNTEIEEATRSGSMTVEVGISKILISFFALRLGSP